MKGECFGPKGGPPCPAFPGSRGTQLVWRGSTRSSAGGGRPYLPAVFPATQRQGVYRVVLTHRSGDTLHSGGDQCGL